MARYTASVCRLCRRENLKLFLKGDRCYSDKCAYERRGYPPGQHGQARGKHSDYKARFGGERTGLVTWQVIRSPVLKALYAAYDRIGGRGQGGR